MRLKDDHDHFDKEDDGAGGQDETFEPRAQVDVTEHPQHSGGVKDERDGKFDVFCPSWSVEHLARVKEKSDDADGEKAKGGEKEEGHGFVGAPEQV